MNANWDDRTEVEHQKGEENQTRTEGDHSAEDLWVPDALTLLLLKLESTNYNQISAHFRRNATHCISPYVIVVGVSMCVFVELRKTV